MRCLVLIIAYILLLSSCNCKKETGYYIIPEVIINDSVFPAAFYGQHNFILTEDNKVFYHNNYLFHSCGTGIDFSKPPKLYLRPDSLTEIKDLSKFLKDIPQVVPRYGKQILVSISSANDTIKNSHFSQLFNFYKPKKEFITNVRMWTEEEQYVTESKIKNVRYNPNDYKWEVGFDQGDLKGTIKFVPPVID